MNNHVQTIQQIPFGWSVLIAIVLAALCLYFLSRVFKNLKFAQMISSTPHSKLRSAAQGFVKISGKSSPLPETEPLLSPLKKTPCCWYRYSIAREEQDDKGNTEWVTIAEGESSQLFHLTDDTGHCVIFPAGSQVISTEHDTWYHYGDIRDDDHAAGFLGKLGHIIDKTRRYRYQEHWIAPDQETIALGFFQTLDTQNTPNPIPNNPGSEKIKAKMDKLKNASFKHSFLNQLTTGLIDSQFGELEKAKEQWDSFSKTNPKVNFLSHHQLADRPFIISDLKQADLVSHYRRSVFGNIIGFIGFGVATIVFVFLKFHGSV